MSDDAAQADGTTDTVPEVRDSWKTVGRCSGECCRVITLSADPELIARQAAFWRDRRRAYEAERNGPFHGMNWDHGPHPVSDAEFVEANFIPMRLSYDDGITKKRREHRGPGFAKPMQQYRCAKWDGTTKRCTDYENRPTLCSKYGVVPGQGCPVPGCTLRILSGDGSDYEKWLIEQDRLRDEAEKGNA